MKIVEKSEKHVRHMWSSFVSEAKLETLWYEYHKERPLVSPANVEHIRSTIREELVARGWL